MTDAAFIFALCLGAALLAGMLIAAHVTARKLEASQRSAVSTAVKLTPEEVHAAGEGPFERRTSTNLHEDSNLVLSLLGINPPGIRGGSIASDAPQNEAERNNS